MTDPAKQPPVPLPRATHLSGTRQWRVQCPLCAYAPVRASHHGVMLRIEQHMVYDHDWREPT